MKKVVIALALVCLAAAPASAQSVLSKLKEKASEAMGNVTSVFFANMFPKFILTTGCQNKTNPLILTIIN